MRNAAGIILIIVGVVGLADIVRNVIVWSGSCIPPSASVFSMVWGLVVSGIAFGGFLVAGGVFSLKRRYFGLCLASALVTLLITIPSAVGMLQHADVFMVWRYWIMVVGTLVSAIFIALRKKEWEESDFVRD
jgi:hypothetical protein